MNVSPPQLEWHRARTSDVTQTARSIRSLKQESRNECDARQKQGTGTDTDCARRFRVELDIGCTATGESNSHAGFGIASDDAITGAKSVVELPVSLIVSWCISVRSSFSPNSREGHRITSTSVLVIIPQAQCSISAGPGGRARRTRGRSVNRSCAAS